MRRFVSSFGCALLFVACLLQCGIGNAAQGDPRSSHARPAVARASSSAHFGDSPFAPPTPDDTTFVVDRDTGLDTGCSFRSAGPLVFTIPISRFPGDKKKLLASGLMPPTVLLRMPAFDVDFAGASGVNPERDRVFFNGRLVSEEFLTGSNNTWKLNTFRIPTEWVEFPPEAAAGGMPAPAKNTIRIDIDTANTTEVWCTSIDWAALTIEIPPPVLLVHGIFSRGDTWRATWLPGLDGLGIPALAIDVGPLDTIQNNAARVAQTVAEMRKRWGVDKVNIVAHSKGGLDSRHYAEANDTVATLVQIGTPNAGSPLADLIQAGSIAALGAVPVLLIDTLVGPAAVQLTTGFMALYNAVHGPNAHTSYVALAGDYRFGGFGILDTLLAAIYLGANDLFVPVWSVHSFGAAAPLAFPSAGAFKEAQHTHQTGSPAIFARLSPYLAHSRGAAIDTALSATRHAPRTAPGASTPAPDSAGTIVGTVRVGEQKSHQVTLETCDSVAFTLYHGTGNLGFTLVGPNGVRIDQTSPASDSSVEFLSYGEIDGLRLLTYVIRTPQPGVWTLQVEGTAVPAASGQEPYFLMTQVAGSTIHLSVGTSQATYGVGESLVIRAALAGGSNPVLGAAVEAKIKSPDGSTATISLLDDGHGDDSVAGDGVYSGRMGPTSLAGLYVILVRAAGPPGFAFTRENSLLVPVRSSNTTLGSGISDSGNDTDGDGLFNELVIQLPLNVTRTATYRVFAELADRVGQQIAISAVSTQLNAGAQVVTLRFDGARIGQHNVDGPYVLATVRVAEEDQVAILPTLEAVNVYTTTPYLARQFQRSGIIVLGTGMDRGVDTDNNGLFDQLDVGADIDVLHGGSYSWSARLVDRNGVEIGFASGSGALPNGMNRIPFTFDGRKIGGNGVDGPYLVVDVLIFGDADSAVVFNGYQTTAYRVGQFENSRATTGLRGDIDCDGKVGVNDLRILMHDLNKTVSESTCGARCDLNGDGVINLLDARMLLGLFGQTAVVSGAGGCP